VSDHASAPRFSTVFVPLISPWVPAKAQETPPQTTLAEADRLAMLYNWPRAIPLYEDAEREFRRLNDRKGELDARLGWLRAQAYFENSAATPSPGSLRLPPSPPRGRGLWFRLFSCRSEACPYSTHGRRFRNSPKG
jgi:hypothetical protein